MINEDVQITDIIVNSRYITVWQIAERLKVSHIIIENHIKGLGLTKKAHYLCASGIK